MTILLCYDFYTHKSLFSAALRYKKGKLTPETGYLHTCTVMIQELGGALQNCFTHRALPRCRGSYFEKSTVKGGKRRRGEPGRVGVHKWYSDFPVVPVGTGIEEYF